MKTCTIKLHKSLIHAFVDNATYKLMDATMEDKGERMQSAAASDSLDNNDGFLITEFCDRRDANIRTRLKFCLDPGTEAALEVTNEVLTASDYEYKVNVENEFTLTQLRTAMKKMDEYIKRGAVLSWYLNAGLEPTDTEAALDAILDDLVYILRGQPWGHRPMQPFGPAMFNFKKGNL